MNEIPDNQNKNKGVNINITNNPNINVTGSVSTSNSNPVINIQGINPQRIDSVPNSSPKPSIPAPVSSIVPRQETGSGSATTPQSQPRLRGNLVDRGSRTPEEDKTKITEILGEIKRNINNQPENIRDLFSNNEAEILKSIYKTIELDGKTYAFSYNISGTVYSLVKENGSNEYKMVFFRLSDSDNQFKSLPSYRKDGRHFSKGEEDNPRHHYVQAAKINPKIYDIISNSPANSDISNPNIVNITKYIPVEEGRYQDLVDFKENFYEFRNQESKIALEQAEKIYKKGFEDLHRLRARSLGRQITKIQSELTTEQKNTINSILGNSKDGQRVRDILNDQTLTLDRLFAVLKNFPDRYPAGVREIADIVKSVIYKKSEKFAEETKLPFEPTFTEQPIKTYKKGSISIEEYLTITPEGDEIIFAMALDANGRVYVDNVYSRNARITKYGTYDPIVNVGLMVYKPEDYEVQTLGIDPKYLRQEGVDIGKVDMADYLAKIPIINRYRQILKQRGVSVRALKSEITR